jgi:transcriptional regulator with XRE-family HTH domain
MRRERRIGHAFIFTNFLVENMNLGNAIKLCRTQKNLKQSELAELANISVSYISLLERGKRDPNLSTIENIASALNVPVGILLFLGAEKGDLSGFSSDLVEKLSYQVLYQMKTE